MKVTAPDLLRAEVRKKRKARVWVSGVCDPYQPLEARYRLTRQCLEILVENQWPVVVQTRSPLVLRDLDILTEASGFSGVPEVEVGFSVTTADDGVRGAVRAAGAADRREAQGARGAARRGHQDVRDDRADAARRRRARRLLVGKVDRVLMDRMNYHYADAIYRSHGLEHALTDEFFRETAATLGCLQAERHRLLGDALVPMPARWVQSGVQVVGGGLVPSVRS